MRRVNSFIIGIVLLFGSAAPVFAITVSPRPSLPKKTGMEERIASREAKLDDRKKTIVTTILGHAKRMLERAKNYITILDGIWARVQARITKLQGQGVDTSSLSADITAVATQKQAALAAIDSANTAMTALEGSSQPKEAVQTFLKQYATVKASVKTYHQSIITVITKLSKLRPGKVSGTPAASPTP